MQQHLLRTADDAVVIFGSSFPNDQEYTQVKCTTVGLSENIKWQFSLTDILVNISKER